MFYDANCPLCSREIGWLSRRIPPGRVRFEDIDSLEVDAALQVDAALEVDAAALGLSRRELMDRIHGQLPSGEIVSGMEVFRRLYAAAGLGWLLAPTLWPGLRWLADRAYEIFARNRLALTGRSSCEAGSCSLAD